jgi:hypothetical protein
MSRPLVATLLLVAACSPGEPAGSTTTSVTQPATTTTTVATTSTTTVASTTTSAAVTTTTAATPSTSLLVGNWADQPLVTAGFGALGWWDGSEWLSAETEGALPVVGGEDYQVVTWGSVAVTTGGPQTSVCEPLGLIGVELEDPGLLGELPGPYGLAISAPWPLQPHPFQEIADDGTYAGAARELLASRGLDVPAPVMKQVVQVDLEGDGATEVLAVAEEVTPGFILEPGDYSIAFLHKVVGDQVQTAVLGSTVVQDENDAFSGAHLFGTVADLNGDSKMEIVLNSTYFEGFGISVWEYADDDLGPVVVLETGCGS